MKIITLTGNTHNKYIPRGSQITMGNYCVNNTLFPKNKTCSIRHYYAEGTMMNSQGNGLELRTVEFTESTFTQSVDFHNYFLFLNEESSIEHSCIWYTREVHHSPVVKH